MAKRKALHCVPWARYCGDGYQQGKHKERKNMQEVLKKLYGEAVTEENLARFHEELGRRFVSKADFNQRGEELKTLREQNAYQEQELSALRETVLEAEHLRQQLECEMQKHEAEMEAYHAQESEKQLRDAVDRALTEAGARNLTAVKALLNLETISLEDGKLQGLAEQLWELKKENSYLFDMNHQDIQFICPSEQKSHAVTSQDFQKMGYMERLKLKREQPELYRSIMQTNRR
ncbi:MAG: hypothetical protein E7393_04870 [Ruminococcaceae bacterium]|nr:hypothetical protein [Oscillospiraceae bacterium]